MRYTVASFFTLLVIGVASGVPDDPMATANRLPMAPDPAGCATASWPEDRLLAPHDAPAASASGTRAAPLPDISWSAPPRDDDLAEAAAILRDLAACMSTGELHRVTPLFTDDARPDAIAALASGAFPSPGDRGPDAGRVVIVWAGEPWRASGRRLAVPAIMRHGARAETRSLVILERQDGRYRIAAIVAVDPGSGPPAAASTSDS